MYKIRVNDLYDFEISSEKDKTLANGVEIQLDTCRIDQNHFHILYKNRSYNAELIEVLYAEKKCSIKMNNRVYHLDVKDRYDDLLHRLGLDNLATLKVAEVKAPMPGLVLDILVKAGDSVQKGDSLLVLEAMKMENIIKSPAEGVIKSVQVQKTDKVEKGQIMIMFR